VPNIFGVEDERAPKSPNLSKNVGPLWREAFLGKFTQPQIQGAVAPIKVDYDPGHD
jgi:hypothetical protein